MQSVPVFLINLDRRPDRLAQMRSEFEGVGVQFERVPAVDAKNPSQSLDVWTFDPRTSTGPATLCNLLSHLTVMRRIVADGIPLAMVMEDDVELSPDVLELLSRSDWLPEGTGVVQCEGRSGSRSGIRLLGSAHSATPVPGRNLHRLHSRAMGSACYIVTRGAAELLVHNTKVCLPTDHLLFNSAVSPLFSRLGVSVLFPAIATQSYGGSDSDIRNGSHGLKRRTNYGRLLMLATSLFKAYPRQLLALACGARFLNHRYRH